MMAVEAGRVGRTLMTDDEREMVFELATALSSALLVLSLHEPEGFRTEGFRSGPIIDRLAHVAAMMEAHGHEVPLTIRDVLRKAAEAGRPIGTA